MTAVTCQFKKVLERDNRVSLEISFEFTIQTLPRVEDWNIGLNFPDETYPFDAIDVMDWLKAELYPFAETLMTPENSVHISFSQLRVVADESWDLAQLEKLFCAAVKAQVMGLSPGEI